MRGTTHPKARNIRQEKERKEKRTLMVKVRPKSSIATLIIVAGAIAHRLAVSPMLAALVVKGVIKSRTRLAVFGGVPVMPRTPPKEKGSRRKARTRAKAKEKRTKESRGTRDSADLGWARPS